MQPEYSQKAGKNIFTLNLKKDNHSIRVRSNFDSGNLAKVQIGLNNSLVLTPAHDCAGTQYESHAKGWFYFAVSGIPIGSKQKFVIKKMNQLGGQSKFADYFKPVFRYAGDKNWERITNAVAFNKEQETQLHFQFQFQKDAEVFFAYTFPFSFDENEKFLIDLKNQVKGNKNIYYHDETLVYSVEGKPLHLITISSNDLRLPSRQSPIDEFLFPSSQNRSFKFSQAKKVLLFSARVHPGQTPSSHTMNGLLKFLVSRDVRAQILRKNFVVKLVPMLNPDGVFNGHYRMDTLNQNLNRYYLQPNYLIQPSSFALKKLGQYFKLEDRLCFFMDLHAHPQRKGNFIYGNSLQSNEEQIQTQLFPKILSLNCVEFDYENSCFSKNHMTHKDRNEDFTKEGCSRVVFNKVLGIIHSYTMQCGYTASNYFNQLAPLSNPHRKIQKMGVIQDEIENIKSSVYSSQKKKYLSVKTFENLGKCIAVSILDLYSMNPYSRLPNGNLKNLQDIRKVINESLFKNNGKQFKVYGNKFQVPIHVKKIQRSINNQTVLLGRSVPKPALINLFQKIEKKVVSSKFIGIQRERKQKQKQKIRRKTLPKMRNAK